MVFKMLVDEKLAHLEVIPAANNSAFFTVKFFCALGFEELVNIFFLIVKDVSYFNSFFERECYKIGWRKQFRRKNFCLLVYEAEQSRIQFIKQVYIFFFKYICHGFFPSA